MTGISLALFVEALVALLLIVTIAYCVILHGKLKWLRSDQAQLKAIVGELNAATAKAEHAIAALCTVSSGAEKTLDGQLARTRELTAGLATGIAEAEHFLVKLTTIVQTTEKKPLSNIPPPSPILRPAVRVSEVGLGRLNAKRRNADQATRKEVA